MTSNGKLVTDGYSEFPEEFRKQILALMLKPEFAVRYGSIIRPEYFVTDREVLLAEIIHKHREVYGGSLPTKADTILDSSRRRESPLDTDYINDVFELSKNGLHRTEEEVRNWSQNSAVRKAFVDSFEDYEQGKLQKITDRFRSALSVGDDLQDEGKDLLKLDWLDSSDLMGVVSTPWRHMNAVMKGGLAAGELGVVLAPTNSHKSNALINLGFHAAGVVNALNVIHFTLEMSAQRVLHRYALRTCFKDPAKLGREEYVRLFRKESDLKLRGKIKVKQYPTGQATVQELWDFVKRMQDRGFVPGLVIVDYPSLLKSSRHYKERRFESQEIHRDVRAMGVKESFPVWSAAQSTRGSDRRKVITENDVAEDIGIAQICDTMFSINQTKDEVKLGRGRFFMAKTREGEKAGIIDIKVNFPSLLSLKYTREVEEDAEGQDQESGKKANRRQGVRRTG
jgi:hypothetical protein